MSEMYRAATFAMYVMSWKSGSLLRATDPDHIYHNAVRPFETSNNKENASVREQNSWRMYSLSCSYYTGIPNTTCTGKKIVLVKIVNICIDLLT